MCSQMNKSVINKDKKVKKMSEIIALQEINTHLKQYT